MTECRHRGRGAALTLHFGEGDAPTLAAARAHVESCAACRDYAADLSALQGALGAWADEPPPPNLRPRVLSRALAAGHQAPAPAAAPAALPLFALLPVMAVLIAGIRGLAAWLPAAPYSPRFDGLAALEVLGPTGTAALLMLALGAFVTLALAPALFLESQGPARRRPHALGLHG